MIFPEDIAVITTARNTPSERLDDYFQGITKLKIKYPDIPIIFFNDNSTDEWSKSFKDRIKRLPFKIIYLHSKKWRGIGGGLYYAAKKAKELNKVFTMKVDSDDIILDLPPNLNRVSSNIDFYVKPGFPRTKEQWFFTHTNNNGGLVRTDLMLEMYKYHERFLPMQKYIAEDQFFIGRYFLYLAPQNPKIQWYRINLKEKDAIFLNLIYQKFYHSISITRDSNGVDYPTSCKLVLSYWYGIEPFNFPEETGLEFIDKMEKRINDHQKKRLELQQETI